MYVSESVYAYKGLLPSLSKFGMCCFIFAGENFLLTHDFAMAAMVLSRRDFAISYHSLAYFGISPKIKSVDHVNTK